MKRNYTPPEVDWAKTRPSVTIPDQSLSIQEIVKRYVRGIPVDVIQRQGVYVDQSDHDLEKLSRMDFGEKAAMADALAAEADAIKSEHDERLKEARKHEEEKRKQRQKADAESSPNPQNPAAKPVA